jgi:hypothetical protein
MEFRTVFNVPYSDQHYAIENNSFGKNLIEELVYDVESGIPFDQMIIQTSKQVASLVEKELETKPKMMGLKAKKNMMGPASTITWSYGINTNVKTRESMINLILNEVNVAPHQIISKYLCDELAALEQKSNGRIESASGSHDDVVMAYSFTLFGRRVLIERNLLYVEGELLNGPSPTKIANTIKLATSVAVTDRYADESQMTIQEDLMLDRQLSNPEMESFYDPFGNSY